MSVKKRNTTVGHIPEGLYQPLMQLYKNRSVVQLMAIHTRELRSAAVGTFVPGRVLEIPCSYNLFGPREKNNVM